MKISNKIVLFTSMHNKRIEKIAKTTVTLKCMSVFSAFKILYSIYSKISHLLTYFFCPLT